MSQIRSIDTGPEMAVRSWLFQRRYRFRVHVKSLPGHPDVVLAKFRTLIEVRGCFWHHHKNCPGATTPKSNVVFWKRKFRKNIARDAEHEREWRRLGWQAIVIWECQLKPAKLERTMARVESRLQSAAVAAVPVAAARPVPPVYTAPEARRSIAAEGPGAQYGAKTHKTRAKKADR